MSNGERELLGGSFDRVADDYDASRPGYPEQVFERLLQGMPREGSALEIGSGTGIATEPLAERGIRLTCVEPGAQLLSRARTRLARFSTVSFLQSKFESAPLHGASFDLVFAAQSFHWLDPASRLTKISRLLRPGGTLALFGNAHVYGDSRIDGLLRAAWDRHAPDLADCNPALDTYVASTSPLLAEISGDDRFGAPSHCAFQWTVELPPDRFVRLLRSYSHVQRMEAVRRERLLSACAKVVADEGDDVQVSYRTGLILAKRRATSH